MTRDTSVARLPFAPADPFLGAPAAGDLDLPRGDGEDRRLEAELLEAARRPRPPHLRLLLDGHARAPGDRRDVAAGREARLDSRRTLLALARIARREDPGLPVTLVSRSSVLLHDLDLLPELDAVHALTVEMVVPALDPELAARLEGWEAGRGEIPDDPWSDRTWTAPEDRLATVAALAAVGLGVRLVVSPLVPFVNDGEAVLQPLLEGAREAGAFDATARPLALSGAGRRSVLEAVRRDFPGVAADWTRLYRHRGRLGSAAREERTATFRRLRLACGFPRGLVGRG